MAVRKALVMVNGRVQQLQSADSLGGPVAENNTITQTAAATLIAGQIVCSSAADTVNKAKADAAGTVNVVGLAAAAITSAATGSIQTSGVVTLTTAEWDAVFGTTGGLTFNSRYYLSAATAGLGTATAPSSVGQYVREIGTAISTTSLLVSNLAEVLL